MSNKFYYHEITSRLFNDDIRSRMIYCPGREIYFIGSHPDTLKYGFKCEYEEIVNILND